MCQHNLPCSIVYAHCLLPGRAFTSLYVLLFLEKEAEIGGRENVRSVLLCFQLLKTSMKSSDNDYNLISELFRAFFMLYCHLLIFFKINTFEKFSQEYQQFQTVSNSFDPDEPLCFGEPESLQRLSADGISGQKPKIFFAKESYHRLL